MRKQIYGAAPLEKLIVPQLAKELPTFYGTGNVITLFKVAHHLFLS
jgi:hypothetical protein